MVKRYSGSHPQARLIIQESSTDVANHGTGLQFSNGPQIQLDLRNGSNTVSYGPVTNDNEWYHLVMVYTGSGDSTGNNFVILKRLFGFFKYSSSSINYYIIRF